MEFTDDSTVNNVKQRQDLGEVLRRQCGCLRTSEKLRQVLRTFPSPPPPSPLRSSFLLQPRKPLFQDTCISSYCTNPHQSFLAPSLAYNERALKKLTNETTETTTKKDTDNRVWGLVTELVHIVQLAVTATALALYYVIFCYMQLVYYTLKSALYFHNADGPMKITIGVVTLTSIVIGFNVLLRLERIVELFLFQQ